jgi:hypothetical protein
MDTTRVCGIICILSVFLILPLTAYYEHQARIGYYATFTEVSASVSDVSPNAYQCSYISGFGSGCDTTPPNTPKCDDMRANNQPGVCDSGYVCCRRSGSSCTLATQHLAKQVNQIQCYRPTVTFNLAFSDGSYKQLTQQKGTCDIPTIGAFNPYACMINALDGFYLGRQLLVYYIPQNYVQSESPSTTYNMRSDYIAGYTIPCFMFFFGICLLFCNFCNKTSDDGRPTPMCILPFHNCCNYCSCCRINIGSSTVATLPQPAVTISDVLAQPRVMLNRVIVKI